MTRAEFRSEARAYERLQAFPELELFAPKYFGRADPTEVPLKRPDAATKYLRGCGLVLEHIFGVPAKLAHVEPVLQSKAEAVLKRFRYEVDIRNVWDASCFIPGSRAEFTVIDFGGWDNFADYQISLNETGRLSAELRMRLESDNAN